MIVCVQNVFKNLKNVFESAMFYQNIYLLSNHHLGSQNFFQQFSLEQKRIHILSVMLDKCMIYNVNMQNITTIPEAGIIANRADAHFQSLTFPKGKHYSHLCHPWLVCLFLNFIKRTHTECSLFVCFLSLSIVRFILTCYCTQRQFVPLLCGILLNEYTIIQLFILMLVDNFPFLYCSYDDCY